VRGNLQSGLFLIGLGATVLVAWWAGAFALIGEELVATVRAPAGAGKQSSAAPAPAGIVIPFPSPTRPAASA